MISATIEQGQQNLANLDAGRNFIDSLKMFYHIANIGDARSLAIHPASVEVI